MHGWPTLTRFARLVAIAIVIAMGISHIGWAIGDLHFNDLGSYQAAAMRIREGDLLYGGNVTPFTKYYYAPWFAFAFVPLSYLPWPVLAGVWTAFTVACSIVAVWPLLRHGSPAALMAAGLLGPILVALSISGNVHAPMLAMLVLLMRTRWGPIAIGVAASLKATPIVLVVAYVGQRQWGHATLAIAVAALLWAPMLLFEVAPITFESGGAALPMPIWLGLAGVGALGAILVAVRLPHVRWLAASVAVFLAAPRLYLYDVTILSVAIAGPGPRSSNRAAEQGSQDSPHGG